MLTLAVKCESCLCLCLCCAAHNINKSVPNGAPFPSLCTLSLPLPVHILAGHEIKFAPESMQRQRRHSCRRCAKVANHQALPSLTLSLSFSSRWTAVNYEQVGHNRNTCRCCCQTFLRLAQLCVAAKVFSCGEINL